MRRTPGQRQTPAPAISVAGNEGTLPHTQTWPDTTHTPVGPGRPQNMSTTPYSFGRTTTASVQQLLEALDNLGGAMKPRLLELDNEH
jgi:hypothetical protein